MNKELHRVNHKIKKLLEKKEQIDKDLEILCSKKEELLDKEYVVICRRNHITIEDLVNMCQEKKKENRGENCR
ncbi:conjugal transfer protein [Streptococcus mitis]|jgi:hypothetical protein|uniref:conjugal transfer protein n=1 Tax=Streptococcus mitis TaxID=28037 RepID=UPI0025F3F905|nr:conjugal transfer protein [uncultured Streptococcus sp.]